MADSIYTQLDARETAETIIANDMEETQETQQPIGPHSGKAGRAGHKGGNITIEQASLLTDADWQEVNANLGIVGKVAGETSHLGGTFEERFSAGYIGLVRGFEVAKEQGLIGESKVKKLFSNVLAAIQWDKHPVRQTQVRRAIREAQVMVARNFSEDDAETVHLPVVALDAQAFSSEDDGDTFNSELVSDTCAVNPFEACCMAEDKGKLNRAMEVLSETEKAVLSAKYLEEKSGVEIAKEYGKSSAWVTLTIQAAKAKLHRALNK